MPIIYMSSEVETEKKRTIPWAEIEPRIRSFVQSLNLLSGISTDSSCEGHIKPEGDHGFLVESAHVALRVSEKRFVQVLEAAVDSGIMDIGLRFFDDGWFWVLISWEPGDYKPIYAFIERLEENDVGG